MSGEFYGFILWQSSFFFVLVECDGSVVIHPSLCASQLGEVLKRDKTRCVASVQLFGDREALLSISFDDICEYTGDVHAQHDF